MEMLVKGAVCSVTGRAIKQSPFPYFVYNILFDFFVKIIVTGRIFFTDIENIKKCEFNWHFMYFLLKAKREGFIYEKIFGVLDGLCGDWFRIGWLRRRRQKERCPETGS
ncbi:MAG: hypothetical protein IJ238_06950 [Acidaminococcaceae bacterium]|nr:hypothetical protein [Acidaminococcaceae bacterium]